MFQDLKNTIFINNGNIERSWDITVCLFCSIFVVNVLNYWCITHDLGRFKLPKCQKEFDISIEFFTLFK